MSNSHEFVDECEQGCFTHIQLARQLGIPGELLSFLVERDLIEPAFGHLRKTGEACYDMKTDNEQYYYPHDFSKVVTQKEVLALIRKYSKSSFRIESTLYDLITKGKFLVPVGTSYAQGEFNLYFNKDDVGELFEDDTRRDSFLDELDIWEKMKSKFTVTEERI